MIISVKSEWLMERMNKSTKEAANTINLQQSSIALGKAQAYKEMLDEYEKNQKEIDSELVNKFLPSIVEYLKQS